MNNSSNYKDSYVLMKKKGYGEYGVIYRVKNKITNEERAIKISYYRN